jgi:hypothetical protein
MGMWRVESRTSCEYWEESQIRNEATALSRIQTCLPTCTHATGAVGMWYLENRTRTGPHRARIAVVRQAGRVSLLRACSNAVSQRYRY